MQHVELPRPLGDGFLEALVRAVELVGDLAVGRDTEELVRHRHADNRKANQHHYPVEVVVMAAPLGHQYRRDRRERHGSHADHPQRRAPRPWRGAGGRRLPADDRVRSGLERGESGPRHPERPGQLAPGQRAREPPEGAVGRQGVPERHQGQSYRQRAHGAGDAGQVE